MRLTLASASPRRLDLLARIGVVPDAVIPAEIDETPRRGELPRSHVFRMASEKAVAVAELGSLTLAADTVVATGRLILPKTETVDEAKWALSLLSGRRHRVLTAIALIDGNGVSRQRLAASVVTFKRLSEEELSAYLDCGEWLGKAGGYAIQGRAEALIRAISGSYSSIVGLPLYETRALLRSAGYPIG